MPLAELLEVLASGKETEELLLDPNSLEGVDVEPKMGDLVVCQLELNTPEVMPLVELIEVLALGKETEELLPDPNSLEGVEEPNRELLELRGAAPVTPNDEDVAGNPNRVGML